MNNRIRSARLGLAARCLTLALPLGAALASTVSAQEFAMPKTLADMVVQADSVEVVDVVSATPHRNARGNLIVTDYRLHIVQNVIGNISGELTLTQVGGTFGGETQAISDTAPLVVGSRYLVFVRPHPGALFSPFVGGAQGVFAFVENDKAVSLGGHDIVRDRDPLMHEVTALAAARGFAAPRAEEQPASSGTSYPQKEYQPLGLMPPAPSSARDPEPTRQAPAPAHEGATRAADTAPMAPAQTRSVTSPDWHYSHLIAPPAVINAFPHDWEWHPYEENQLAYWNEYGGTVFQVYTDPDPNWAWGNNRFDLAGWPDDTQMLAQFGEAWPAGYSGITFSRWGDDGVIIESDTALNPVYCWTLDDVWATDGTGSCQSFRATMLHEVGHGWGLDHPWETQVVAWDSVMNYSDAPYRFTRLFADDTAAVRNAFAGPGIHDALIELYTVSASSGVGAQPVYNPTQSNTAYVGHGQDLALQMATQFEIENLGTDDIVTPQVDFYLSQNRMNYDATVAYIGSGYYSTIPTGWTYTYWLPSLPIPASTPTGLYYFSAYVPAPDADGNNNSAWATQNWNNATVQVEVTNNPTLLTPTGNWQLSETGSLGPTGDWEFYFYADAGAQYTFSLCPEVGGWATFDTVMSVTYAGDTIASDDDTCDLQSEVTFTAPYSAEFTLTVGSYLSAYQGTFQVAYLRSVADPVYHDGFDG